MPEKISPFYPIVYVRGYAMTQGEINDTTADPFCGFNLGSTVYRAVPGRNPQTQGYKAPRKYIFESPIVRLASEFGYQDVYEDGCDILDPGWDTTPDGKPTGNLLSNKSILIFRYYDEASTLLGIGKTPDIGSFATELGALIHRTRELVCANEKSGMTPETFRCYLVGHSMGGLVCRALLQNPAFDPHNARQYVDKLFTFATPHNGIEMLRMNVPGWLTQAYMNNFNREYMAEYLNLKRAFKETGRVDWIPEECFPPERVFCMVGSNRTDYEVALGLSRTFAGHGSDGLVKIENATLNGIREDSEPGQACAKAVAFRAHSGYFGIVNSEEAYQNLVRFLFGDVRVDIWVDVHEVRLPKEVQKLEDAGRSVNALYQFEILASPRGKLWYLTRRTAEEDSVACVTHEDLRTAKTAGKSALTEVFLSSVFLANRARVNPRRRSLAYKMTLGVRVPDYEIDRKLWVDDHYEGSYLFRNTILFELTPPAGPDLHWKLKYGWQDIGVAPVTHEVDTRDLSAATLAGQEIELKVTDGNKLVLGIPFENPSSPGIRGNLRLIVQSWNAEKSNAK